MRIASGVTDQYIYFVAVDATDFTTRETGLSSFTVYRSRNGGAAAAYTTPTINETDSTNMPGVYELLLDEDMTIGSGNDTEEICLHITQASMAPVTRVIELYRPKITAGNTLSVESDGDLTKVNTLDGHTAQTGDNFARLGAPAGASVSADIAAIEAQTDDIGVAGAGLSAIPWNSSWDAQVESEVNDALIALGLDHLVSASVAGTDVADNSIVAKLVSASATADWDDFVNTTDSLQALRDHVGDGTNLTEAGGDGDHLTAINLPNQTMNITGDITGNLSGSVGSVTAAVTTELSSAHSEPTGVPAANETIADKIGYLFMALRNKVTVTASKKQFFDDGDSAEWEKDLSDDGTTYTETEGNAP